MSKFEVSHFFTWLDAKDRYWSDVGGEKGPSTGWRGEREREREERVKMYLKSPILRRQGYIVVAYEAYVTGENVREEVIVHFQEHIPLGDVGAVGERMMFTSRLVLHR